MFAVAILNLVPRTRIELVMTGYQPIVIPFNYPGIFGGRQKSRTPSAIKQNLVFKASRRTIPAALSSINWYPRSDSNRHDSPFERDASYQLGYLGIGVGGEI